MKTNSKKLPNGLPPLPPVPDGYSRWDLREKWDSNGPVGAPFGACNKNTCSDWNFTDDRLGLPSEKTLGICDYYIVAVRDQKPAPKKRRAGKVQTWVCQVDSGGQPMMPFSELSGPALVIPFDAASREQLVELTVDAVQNVTGERNRVLAVLSILHPDFAKEAK